MTLVAAYPPTAPAILSQPGARERHPCDQGTRRARHCAAQRRAARQSWPVRSRPEQLSDLVAVTSKLLGRPAVVVDDLSFSSRAVVARLDLGNGETAIAKRPFERESFTGEVEALRVLPRDTCPALLGSGDGVLVMEDLGTGPSLADLLLSPAGTPVERALESWARTLGRALRATLRSGVPSAPLDLRAGLVELLALAGELGIAAPAGVEDDVHLIAETLSSQSPWLAYCPGDTCPDNNRVLDDGSVRLFDFEGSGWRHAATEAAYCRAPFCTCWCVAAMPAGMTASMEGAFLDALDPPSRTEFCATVGLADVSWALIPFADYLRRFVHESPRIGPRALLDGRQIVVVRLAAVQAQGERIPALAELAGGVRDAIIRRWPEAAELPRYPAFR